MRGFRPLAASNGQGIETMATLFLCAGVILALVLFVKVCALRTLSDQDAMLTALAAIVIVMALGVLGR